MPETKAPEIEYTAMTDASQTAGIVAMMRGLYAEDEPASAVDPERFPLTIDFFLREPGRGRIVLFRESGALRGYAILVPIWSNEFGGTMLLLDELFVLPEARNRGIAKGFLAWVAEGKPFDAIGIALEVSPGNKDARRLYESLGFSVRHNAVLTRRF